MYTATVSACLTAVDGCGGRTVREISFWSCGGLRRRNTWGETASDACRLQIKVVERGEGLAPGGRQAALELGARDCEAVELRHR